VERLRDRELDRSDVLTAALFSIVAGLIPRAPAAILLESLGLFASAAARVGYLSLSS
jgi:hypothetical protein